MPWLKKKLIEVSSVEPQPLQLTLTELTCCSAFINSYLLTASGVIFCEIGAGIKNTKL